MHCNDGARSRRHSRGDAFGTESLSLYVGETRCAPLREGSAARDNLTDVFRFTIEWSDPREWDSPFRHRRGNQSRGQRVATTWANRRMGSGLDHSAA